MKLIPRNYFLDDVFDDFMTPSTNNMKCDIYEDNGVYNIEVDVPGFNKEDIKVETKNGYLTICAEKKYEDNKEGKNYICKERKYGKFERSFYLGELKTDDISAEFNNGVLMIKIPKIEEDRDKKMIEIK